MTEHLTLDGGQLLLASEDDRLVSARLVPFHEQCSSNLGRFTVGPGVLQLPADPAPAILNDGHRRESPLGVGVVYAEQADGVHASWRIANSPAGDAALADIKAGKRRAVSVEAEVAIVDGRAVAGHVFAAALVGETERPAFPSALLMATAATDVTNPEDPTTAAYSTLERDPGTGETYETETTVEETEDTDPDTGATILTRTTTATTTITPGTPAEGQAPVTNQPAPAAPADQTVFAQVPGSLLPPRRRSSSGSSKAAGIGTQQLYAMLSASKTDPAARAMLSSKAVQGTLFAELTDVAYDGAGAAGVAIEQPQYLGELWSGKDYVRKFVPLFAHGDLTSFELQGWRWTTKPEMGDWDGNKADVPSSDVATEAYTVRAKRFAGAHDIAREYRDFNVTAFWDGYFKAMTESYARLSDTYALAQALGSVTIDGAVFKNYADVAGGPVPAGVSAVAAKIVDGAMHVIDSDTPTFAIVGKTDYRDLLLTRAQDTMAFLNMALGLEDGTINPANFKLMPSADPKFADGHVLVGAASSGRFHELSQVPIRTEGLDMVHGGIDPGLFGYCAFVSNNPDALAYVAPAA